MNIMDYLSNIPAGTVLTCLVGIGAGMAVVLCVTVFKCAKGAWKLMTHH